MNDLHLHPDYQQLQQQVESLREQMADRLAHIHELENVVKPNLFALYQSKLGPWELKLLAAQCEVARLKRKIALAQTSLNREQPIEWSRIDEQLAVEFLSWKTRIAEAASKIQNAKVHFQHTLSSEDSAELKKLYYALVKALHPDLHPDQADADQQLWHQVQSAYLAVDLKKLKALMVAISTEHPLPDSPKALEQLKAKIESLERHIQQLAREIDRIAADPPFTLESQLLSETWIETRRAKINSECAALTNLRIQLEAHVAALAAHPTNGKVTGLN